MKVTLKIELGNDGMQTGDDVRWALEETLARMTRDAISKGMAGKIIDYNGNTVGSWEVTA